MLPVILSIVEYSTARTLKISTLIKRWRHTPSGPHLRRKHKHKHKRSLCALGTAGRNHKFTRSTAFSA